MAVMGPSGCGKPTLLHLIGELDRPTNGSVFIEGNNISKMSHNTLTELRHRKMGFVFPVLQSHPRAGCH